MWKKENEAIKTIQDIFVSHMGLKEISELQNILDKHDKQEYELKGVDNAGNLIPLEYICMQIWENKKNPITIVGDYDADGITSTCILVKTLSLLGFKVKYRIPKRFTEGFGINEKIIDEISEGVIITCDNGTAQPEIIAKAKEKGLMVIITDHHQPHIKDGKKELPPADFIVNPHAIDGSSDFDDYCGAMICYKLMTTLLQQKYSIEWLKTQHKREMGFEIDEDSLEAMTQTVLENTINKLKVFAAIGTVADVMPLKEENYAIVKSVINSSEENPMLIDNRKTTVGLNELVKKFNLSSNIAASDIGFRIAPALNAASRMADEGANTAVELLLIDKGRKRDIAEKLSDCLYAQNEKRKSESKSCITIATEKAEKELSKNIIILYIPEASEGIVGIIAGNICDKHKKPCIICTDGEEGVLKGSARSCNGVDIKEELDKIAPLLLKYGGHEGAAGLSFLKTNFEEIKKTLEENIILEESAEEINLYHLEISAEEITEDLIKNIKDFEPYGEGNPAPVFKINNFKTIEKNGKRWNIDKKTGFLQIYGENNVSATAFSPTPEQIDIVNKNPSILTIYGEINENIFFGKKYIKIHIKDIEI